MAHAEQEQQQEQSQSPYRWVILAAAFVMVFMTVGTRSTLGVFLKTIVQDLGWDRGTISMVIAVNIWLSGLLQPFTGYVMDRYGAKWLFTISSALFGCGVGLMSLTNTVGYLLGIYGIVLALATAGASIALTNTLVAQWFPAHRRGFAIGINNAGTALGQLTLVYLSALLLQAAGWRQSHLYLGAAIIVLAVPMALLVPRRLHVAWHSRGIPERPRVRAPLETQRWYDALHSAPLWQINAGYFVCGMTISLYYTHLIPFATDRGFSVEASASAFGVLSICSAIGAMLSGTASDYLGRKNIMALAYLVRSGAFFVLLLWRHELALYVFAILGGLSWLATPTSVTALTGEVYGMRHLATLGGVALLVHQLGGGASVWLAGWLYDTTGSYDVSFRLAAFALLGASLVSYVIAERRYSIRHIAAA
jgi:MFS family permease